MGEITYKFIFKNGTELTQTVEISDSNIHAIKEVNDAINDSFREDVSGVITLPNKDNEKDVLLIKLSEVMCVNINHTD